MRSRIAFVACLLALAGCGGDGGGGGATPAPAPTPPPSASPPTPAPPPVIGASGGTVRESTGASVTFPAGAVTDDTTFRIAVDSTGAPPLPAGLTGAGSLYVITPHGGDFQQPVEVSIPVPAVTLLPTQELKLAKAPPNGQWEILADSTVVDGKLEAHVTSFSFFTTVVVTYPLPILQLAPMEFNSTLSCGGQDCAKVLGPVAAIYSVGHDNGQLPESCPSPTMETGIYSGSYQEVIQNTLGSYVFSRTLQPYSSALFKTVLRCPTYTSVETRRYLYWTEGVYSPNLAVERIPAQLDVVEGLQANLDVLMSGGAIRRGPGSALGSTPTRTDRAIIDWERSDDAGASWRQVARSFQDEANPLPFGTGMSWRPWGIRHGFVATATDQNALLRVHGCYTAPTSTSETCVTSSSARINVLQSSALPMIVDPPRSVLIRTGETANLSANVSGAPTPSLQWQSRPANSTGGWTDVSTGSGATSSNYTTAALMSPDNGTQYRVVATNAIGSAASLPVTVSVSDVDVAPSITTQPAATSVASGSDAVFAVVARGTEALSYQWRFNGTPIAGANGAVLRLDGVTGANAGSYSVAVGNSAGNAVSDAAVLTVTAGTPAAVAPSIVTQPRDVTVNTGNTATLAVGVAGTGPFTFQWLRDGTAVNGATSAVLSFDSAALPNAGSYAVRVTNSAGQVLSDSALLNVVATSAPVTAPTITAQPATLVVPLDGAGTLAVGATGSGPLTYQWYLDGNLLPGATLPVLNFSHVGSVDFGSYTVTVANSAGTVTSEPADLLLLGAPAITQQPAAVTAIEGQHATFFVQASGSGLRYQWSVNGTPIPGAIAATFNTPPLVAANSGAVYSVMVYNGAGLVTSQGAVLTVQVIVAPTVTQQPANASVLSGQKAQLCAAFGGTMPVTLHVQRWDGAAWAAVADTAHNGNDPFCFDTDALSAADDGAQFRFVAQNSAGQVATDPATVTVSSPGISATTLVSVELDGGEPDYFSGMPSMSADGRLVAFTSQGLNLVAGGTTNGSEHGHAYLRDLSTGTTSLINRTLAGGVSSRGVANLVLSANGRYALFTSFANDLVADDTNNGLDVFRRDLQTGTTVRVNVLPDGRQIEDAGGGNYDARLAISGDGRFVTFLSDHDLDAGGTGGANDSYYLYVRDLQTGLTRYVDGTASTSPIGYVAISENGRYVAYTLNIVAPYDQTIWLYDNETHLKRAGFTYAQGAYPQGQRPGLAISATGRFIAFAVNSVALTGSASDQVLVVDLDNPDTPILASTGSNGAGDAHSAYPRISGDGRYVLFETYAPNLTGGLATPSRRYSVVRDLTAGTTRIASIGLDGAAAPLGTSDYGSHVISSDGRFVAFENVQVYATPRP